VDSCNSLSKVHAACARRLHTLVCALAVPRGVPRLDDRQISNTIFNILRTGSPWRYLPERYVPYTMAYNRFNQWAKSGVWLRIFDAFAERSPRSLL
jgi:transposase